MTKHLDPDGLDPEIQVTNKDHDPFRRLSPEELQRFMHDPPTEAANVTSIDNLSSGLELNPAGLDNNYQYRWVHKSPGKVARAKAKGYRICTPATDPEVQSAIGDPLDTSDGTYTVGDVVLMRVPKANHQQRRKNIKRHTDERLKGPKRKFRGEARNASHRLSEPVQVITTKEPKGSKE